MSRATANKLYKTFVKGLVTEAGPLTYPENASINEDNCIIYRKGNRSRRFGFNFENNSGTSNYSVAKTSNVAFNEYRWQTVGQDSDVNFLVHQVGLGLYFYSVDGDTVSASQKPFSVDLTSFIAPNITDVNAAACDVQMSAGKGYLFVVGACFEPIYVVYDAVANSVTATKIIIQTRDFKGVDDGLANDEEPTTLSDLHLYNLINQGWEKPTNDATGPSVVKHSPFGGIINVALTARQVASATPTGVGSPINLFHTAMSRYPGNNKQWWVAKDASGTFDPTLLSKTFFGSSRAPRGHFIVNAFNIDRQSVSGINIPPETVPKRPTSIAFFAGRVFYGYKNTLYFSQILDDKRKAGMCYQEADPTSEEISDLVATDGGVIPIPEMGNVQRIIPIGRGLAVFGNNGVWYLEGPDAGFTALDYSVSKINAIGTDSPYSVVESNNKVFYWSKTGIQALAQRVGVFGPVDHALDNTSITETTIQSFYNNIIEGARRRCKGLFDPALNTIQWLFNDGSDSDLRTYNRILCFDLGLEAFYPWTVSPSDHKIIGMFPVSNLLSSGDDTTNIRNGFLKYIIAKSVDTFYYFSVGYFHDENFADWSDQPYMSFVETGYEILEDAMRKKESRYVFTYFRRTESAYVANGDDFDLNHQSSCKFQVKWDWSSSSVSNKWTSKIEAYRLTRIPAFTEDNLSFDTGFPLVVSRHKIRGHGKSIQFRFESNAIGRDFDLLGWAAAISGNTEP